MIIRDATEANTPALTRLQSASWRSAYAGLLPRAYLAGPVEADIAATFARPERDRDIRLVAEIAGERMGVVAIIEKADAPMSTTCTSPRRRSGRASARR